MPKSNESLFAVILSRIFQGQKKTGEKFRRIVEIDAVLLDIGKSFFIVPFKSHG